MAKRRKKTDFTEQRERVRRARELVERELAKLNARRDHEGRTKSES
jgi:hypothetical protein